MHAAPSTGQQGARQAGPAVEFRTRLLSHRGAVTLLLAGPMDGPNALALGERILEVFADAGLTPDDTARACHLFTTDVLGSVALEAAELDHSAPPPPEDKRVAIRHVRFAAVPADRYPRTAATATAWPDAPPPSSSGPQPDTRRPHPQGNTSLPDGCATNEPAAGQPPWP